MPLGAVWPLPAYELALMTAGEAREMGHDDVQVTVVTPEQTPLALFGEEAGEATSEELRWAGVEPRTGVVARKAPGGLLLEPGGDQLDVQRVYAVPRLLGPGDPRACPATRKASSAPTTTGWSRGVSERGRRATASSRR